MRFSALHILTRELRVHARKPWTGWLRVLVGLIAALTTISTLAWAQSNTLAASLPGKAAFNTLSALLLVYSLVEGVRHTADCLSSERREGTLGLLFLTPLTGLDVLLGKLAATSLNSFYSFMAVFPVLAVTLTAGGLTGGEFWRSVLALLNALFFALACGMWTSARQRAESRSLVLGLTLVFGITFLAWILEPLIRVIGWPNVSMSVALHLAEDTIYRTQSLRFWTTLVAGHAFAWLLLVSAGRRLKCSWREDAEDRAATPSVRSTQRAPQDWPPWIRPTDPAEAAFWLARRTWPQRRVLLLMLGVLTLSPLTILFYRLLSPASAVFMGVQYSLWLVPIVAILFIASRPFGEARRSGAMELLLSTPLSPATLVDGYRKALWHRSGGAIAVFLLMAGLFVLFGTPLWFISGNGLGLYMLVTSTRLVVSGLAASWLGLYLGLRFESGVKATGYGLLWILAIPWLGSTVFWMFLRPHLRPTMAGGSLWWMWWIQFFPALVGLLYNVSIIRWSRRQLHTRFRELASGGRP